MDAPQRTILSQEDLNTLNSRRMKVCLMDITEAEYRAHPAVSYSRLSDVEKVGMAALDGSPKEDISKLRGVVLGSIVDEVISNKLDKLPQHIKTAEKIPGTGTITDLAIDCILDKLNLKKFDAISEADLKEFLIDNNLMRNGMTNANFLKKMYNYEEYIDKRIKHKDNPNAIFVNKFDLQIIKMAIKRLRKLRLFRSDFEDNVVETLSYQSKFLAEINGVKIKCMLDALFIDHLLKTIEPIDIKTGVLDVPDESAFFHGAYLTYNYYIQAGLYRKIIEEYFMHIEQYRNYTVLPFKFVYSTTSPKKSHTCEDVFVHVVDDNKHMESFKGFTHKTLNADGSINEIKKNGIAELFKFYSDNSIVF